MITVRAGSGAIGVCLLLVLAGCSREQQDWRSAESSDTIESYGQFIQRHPESELATQARARVVQLGEERDWQHAGSADTVDAYREFLAQHPNGKWAQEAHIRIENFSLGEQAGTDAGTKAASAGGGASGTAGGARSYGLAEPGEAATPAGSSTPRGQTAGVGTAPGAASSAATAASPATTAIPSSHTSPASSAAQAPPGHQASSASQASLAPQASTPSRTSATPQASPPKSSFGIQLGAFTTEAGATAQWHALTSRYATELQGLQQHVVPADTAAGRIYRLQAAVGDEGRARTICDQLKKRGQACVAVLPH